MAILRDPQLARTLQLPAQPLCIRIPAPPSSGGVRLGFIGAGNYATSMLLPHLRDNSGVELVSVATTKALSGLNAQRKFGFGTITTNVESVLDDDRPRRGVHRHAASLACQLWYAKPWSADSRSSWRSRSPLPRSSSPRSWKPSNGPVTIGSWLGSTAGCAAFHRSARTVRSSPWPVLGSLLDQRGSAGPGQLVSQRGTGGITVRR